MRSCLCTTMDNEYNPFTQFDEWFSYDSAMGYNTLGKIAFFFKSKKNMSEEEFNEAFDLAIDKLLLEDPLDLHYKLYEDQAKTIIPAMNNAFKELKITESS